VISGKNDSQYLTWTYGWKYW